MQSFLAGTLTLAAAAVIARLLGVVPKVVLPRTVGMDVLGLYQLAYPVLVFLATVARFGMHVAVAGRVAEAMAAGRPEEVPRLIRAALGFSLSVAVFLALGLAGLAPALAARIYLDPRLAWPLWGLVPAVPIIAAATVFRALFQGLGDMRPPAVGAVVETVVRVALALVLSTAFLPYGAEAAAFGLAVSIALGEIAGLGPLLWRLRLTPLGRRPKRPANGPPADGSAFSHLWRIAYPVGLSGLVGALAYALEPGFVAHSFRAAGMEPEAASRAYGMLSGLAIFVLYFPTTLTYSLSTSLIPAISALRAQKKPAAIHRRLDQSARVTALIAFPTAAFVFVFAEPLSGLLFGTEDVAPLLSVLAPFAPFLYFQGPLGAALQGLGWMRLTFWHTVAGATAKLLLIAVLARQPELGVLGVAWALNGSLALVTLLHAGQLRRRIGWGPKGRDLVPALLAAGAAFLIARAFLYPALAGLGVPAAFLAASFGGFFLYGAFLWPSGGVGPDDVRRLAAAFTGRKAD
ncbi:polysaccharide biosynthesis protein [Hydrogenibacillus sp. N12]|uniref:putative polysaccharide biosynthesis protein n=1 Tax=Hydrogenibacillus sp. N12 TaxID=2866627 RepID=UPI001C7DEB94|nr:polysaccharide biosynthesis protein [Hydrogenibacillus sp. N12]QZA33885.1 polysaccharide biosynthesis protein [Hydrogenibacillus sp. N12]